MATINKLGNGLSGATGSGKFVGSTSPIFVTPILGAATATSLAFSPTTGGLIGTTAADNASAGTVGELLSSALATGVAMSSNVTTQIQTLNLTAGDWDVYGIFYSTVTGSTTCNYQLYAISVTSGFIPGPSTVQNYGTQASQYIMTTGQPYYGNTGLSVWNVNTGTVVYLNAHFGYSGSTLTGNGAIYARRRR